MVIMPGWSVGIRRPKHRKDPSNTAPGKSGSWQKRFISSNPILITLKRLKSFMNIRINSMPISKRRFVKYSKICGSSKKSRKMNISHSKYWYHNPHMFGRKRNTTMILAYFCQRLKKWSSLIANWSSTLKHRN